MVITLKTDNSLCIKLLFQHNIIEYSLKIIAQEYMKSYMIDRTISSAFTWEHKCTQSDSIRLMTVVSYHEDDAV